MTNDSTPEELLLPTEMIAEMSSSSIMRLTTLLFIMVTLTGCSTPQVEHATYLYSDRMTELYYYNTMPQAKYKMNVSCYVEPFDTAKFTNVLSDESMLGSNVLWDLTSFGEGIQQETVRKLKETMFCYDTQSKSVDNSKFIISGRLKSIDTRIGWGFNKKHTTNAILEYNIRYDDANSSTYTSSITLKDYNSPLEHSNKILMHRLLDVLTTQLVSEISYLPLVRNIAMEHPLSAINEEMARYQRNEIISYENRRTKPLLAEKRALDKQMNDQYKRDINQMLGNFQSNVNQILATGNNGNSNNINNNNMAGAFPPSSSSCNPNICTNDPKVIFWKNKSGAYNGANQAPSYCAAAALSKCFIDNELYAESGCATSTTRGQLENLIGTNLSTARNLGTSCW